jgi:hypothetical protein
MYVFPKGGDVCVKGFPASLGGITEVHRGLFMVFPVLFADLATEKCLSKQQIVLGAG